MNTTPEEHTRYTFAYEDGAPAEALAAAMHFTAVHLIDCGHAPGQWSVMALNPANWLSQTKPDRHPAFILSTFIGGMNVTEMYYYEPGSFLGSTTIPPKEL